MFFGLNRSYNVTLKMAERNMPCFDNLMSVDVHNVFFYEPIGFQDAFYAAVICRLVLLLRLFCLLCCVSVHY